MPSIVKVKLDKPEILAWARNEVGLSQKDVALWLKKSEVIVDAWEKGEDAPTFRQLSDLANYYKRPLATFFLPTIPPKSPKPADHRNLPGLTLGRFSKETLIAYREVYNMVGDVEELLDTLNITIDFTLPNFSLSDNPDEKANDLRTLLGITLERQINEMTSYNTALDIWRNALFDRGVIVRICRMPINDARAFCLFHSRLSGIGLSNEDKDHGKIFSLFHEVCHLALRKPGVSGMTTRAITPNLEIEQYCDRFSAAFLLPSSHKAVHSSLSELSKHPSIETARAIANKFKISKYVIIRRALDLRYLSMNDYWDAYNEFRDNDLAYKNTRNSKGGNYYATQISYNGKRYISLIMDAFYRNKINSMDVKRLSGLTPSDIEASL